MISNTKDPIVLEVQQLRKRAFRVKTGRVIVEGLPEVKRAIETKTPIRKLIWCPEILECDAHKIQADEVLEVTKDVFAALAFGSRLKGILALCQPQQKELSDITLSQNALVVVLEAVEKPGNLGAVMRSADGAGVDAILMADSKTDIYNQHVVRSSIGTIFSIPVVAASSEIIIDFLKQNNIKIFAATAKAETLFTACDFKQATALVVGNEHAGLSEVWLESADEQVTIPMEGIGGCLNVTVSASILMYEALRQRHST